MRKKVKIPLSLFGYKKSEIDKMIVDYNSRIASLDNEVNKVLEIKEENDELKRKVTSYEKKEEEVSDVLNIARTKSKDMMLDIELQYALELERLKMFQNKWMSAYDDLKNKYHFEKDGQMLESKIIEVSVQMEELLKKDFGITLNKNDNEAERQFMSEVDRLSISQDEINKLVEKLKLELKKAS